MQIKTSDFRIFNINLKEYVRGQWDEKIPIINHQILEIIIKDKFFSADEISKNLSEFCKEMNFHVINTFEHQFNPQGNSVVFVLE